MYKCVQSERRGRDLKIVKCILTFVCGVLFSYIIGGLLEDRLISILIIIGFYSTIIIYELMKIESDLHNRRDN